MNAAVFEFDRQDILVLHSIFAEAGKPRLSVKPRLVGGELHCRACYPAMILVVGVCNLLLYLLYR
ncbi:MAG: hypothetical protein A2170_02775 [Deltaproteobacteria bacterium RBG_13_53_10]|nr:MAG: hypothetical protein A2170_02775 [Deltaproteobacteria bacterium RBG_13_53_10]